MAIEPDIHAVHAPLQFRLKHLASRLKNKEPIRIVAIGSSSVAGEWEMDIPPFPYRLEMWLRWRWVDRQIPWIDVVNRGKRGEDSIGQKARLLQDVIEAQPAMVIWQVGTNAVWQSKDLQAECKAIEEGLELLRPHPMDIVLMDPQYVPPILTDDKIKGALGIVSEIEKLAKRAGANVFRRFDLMRRWHEDDKIPLAMMINPHDQHRLHQNDWSTIRITWALRDVIVEAADRP